MHATGFSMPAERTASLPSFYMTNFQTGKLELLTVSDPGEWAQPPPFPSGASGLLSTVDDYLSFARLLLNQGMHGGRRLLSKESVELMTTNHLTARQIAQGGPVLHGRGWGYGMAVATDAESAAPGRYGWEGGTGTGWFNDPHQDLVAIVMTQTSDFLFNGGMNDFVEKAGRGRLPVK
jgi:CubicO group peptidase (beta-lactamase class C family)